MKHGDFKHVSNLWDDSKALALAGDEVALLVYRSNLLGADLRLTNYGGGNFKKQFGRADKWGARLALVLGENEVAVQQVVVKNLATGDQETLAQSDVAARLASILG